MTYPGFYDIVGTVKKTGQGLSGKERARTAEQSSRAPRTRWKDDVRSYLLVTF